MIRVTCRMLTSILFPLFMVIRTGRWKPSISKLNNCQCDSSAFTTTTFPWFLMFTPSRTLSRPTVSSTPSFQSPLFHPLRELMDKGRTLPPSPPVTLPPSLPVTLTPSHPHQHPLNPSRPAPQGVACQRKVYTPQFNPQGQCPFGSLLSRVQLCTPSDPCQQVQITGGKGALTQQAHGEFIVSSETIYLPNTQQVHGEYF